jgi:hypothetical protein
MAKNAGDKAEEFTTDLIHMIMWVAPISPAVLR